MSQTANEPTFGVRPLLKGLQELRGLWWLFLILGIALILFGMAAIGAPFLMTLTTVTVFGYLVLVGGVFELFSAFWAGKWGGFFLQILGGGLRIMVGALLVSHPVQSAGAFTLMLAAFLMAGGLFRVVFAISERLPYWGGVVFNGALSFLLGLLIWREWPESSLWVIGLFVGIDLVFAGSNWLMVSLTLRQIPKLHSGSDQ